MKKLFLVSILLLFVLAACQSQTPAAPVTGKTVQVDGGSFIKVNPAELKTMIDNKDFVFVNVHIPFAGDIAGTDLSIPYDTIDQNLSQLPADKHAKIVLYCRSGRMSTIAAQTLVKLGYTNLWELDGGMVAWEKAGYQIEH